MLQRTVPGSSNKRAKISCYGVILENGAKEWKGRSRKELLWKTKPIFIKNEASESRVKIKK